MDQASSPNITKSLGNLRQNPFLMHAVNNRSREIDSLVAHWLSFLGEHGINPRVGDKFSSFI